MALLVPPTPAQVSEYDAVAVSAPVLCEPLVANAPVHPPEAVQEAALVELQVSVEAPPGATTVGFATKVASGTMLTMAVATPLTPPAPLQVNE